MLRRKGDSASADGADAKSAAVTNGKTSKLKAEHVVIEPPSLGFGEYDDASAKEELHVSDFFFKDSDSPVLRFGEDRLVGSGGLAGAINGEVFGNGHGLWNRESKLVDLDVPINQMVGGGGVSSSLTGVNDQHSFLMPLIGNGALQRQTLVQQSQFQKPAVIPRIMFDDPEATDDSETAAMQRTMSNNSLGLCGMASGVEPGPESFAVPNSGLKSEGENADGISNNTFANTGTGRYMTSKQALEEIARRRGLSNVSACSSSSVDTRRQSAYSSFSGGSSSTVEFGIGGSGTGLNSSWESFIKPDASGRARAFTTASSCSNSSSISNSSALSSSSSSASALLTCSQRAKRRSATSKTASTLNSADPGSSKSSKETTSPTKGSKRGMPRKGLASVGYTSFSSYKGDGTEEAEDQLTSVIRSRMDLKLQDPSDILANIDSLATCLLVPASASDEDELGTKKTKRANYTNMDPEEERLARDKSKKRRAALKRRREKVRRTVINALFDELQQHFEPFSVDLEFVGSNPKSPRHAGSGSASTPKAGTPRGGVTPGHFDEKEKKSDQAVILSKCLSIIRRLQHSHQTVFDSVMNNIKSAAE